MLIKISLKILGKKDHQYLIDYSKKINKMRKKKKQKKLMTENLCNFKLKFKYIFYYREGINIFI